MKHLPKAVKIAEALKPLGTGQLPQEIISLTDDGNLIGIVVEVEGIDFILTMQEVPNQRKRPTVH
ncbi:hypothetical protein [Sulfitobacter delicatus]|uniref:Uncharacterized protein n=1 Tax=Sulfitobacter delicatus TaxID=218672 RepID=A0A1G7S7A8_9RHOB|nr:hypothetical protein [Sulfitobacter delicatus]SDG18369.1 hypothetical protein SAMN04489759_10599 [Sulfitobacter delicatus]